MVIARLLLFLVFGVFHQSLLAEQQQNYPFSIDTQKDGVNFRVIARNDGPAPVSVKVSIPEWRGITTDRPFPVFAVVPPRGGVLYLGAVRPAIQGVGFTFKTQSQWLLGDFNAVQSRDATYRLPFQNGLRFRIGQAPGGPITTHTSAESLYAVDIPMPEGTPIVAAREGIVIYTEANQVYGEKSPDMLTKANEVRIQHIDGTIAIYAHMEHGGVHVYPGQKVSAGSQIGLAGSTGYSSGPHLHFAVHTVKRVDSAEGLTVISLPFRFYIGNPPVFFSPTYGMQVNAEYGTRQGPPEAQVVTLQPQMVTTGEAERSLKATPDVTVTFQIPAPIRSWLLGIPTWGWVAGLFGIVALITVLSTGRPAPQRRGQLDFREPVFHLPRSTSEEKDDRGAKERLIRACEGDTERAARLIELEHERTSNINLSEGEAALRALDSIQRGR